MAAAGKIERPAQDRVKPDQRDAERVLCLLVIDGLHAVRVPSDGEEGLGDLVWAREALRGDLMRARQRMSKLLWRREVARLRCLCGVDTLSAVGLCAGVGGDFQRFERPTC